MTHTFFSTSSLTSKQKNARGFTLIELLVAISIIGVLSALLIVNLVGARTRAADAKKKGELQQLKTALRLYYNDFQQYPTSVVQGTMHIGGVNLQPGDAFVVGDTTYMKSLPENLFYYNTDPDQYLMITKLGNRSDEALQKNFDRCCNPTRTNCPATLTDQFILCED